MGTTIPPETFIFKYALFHKQSSIFTSMILFTCYLLSADVVAASVVVVTLFRFSVCEKSTQNDRQFA